MIALRFKFHTVLLLAAIFLTAGCRKALFVQPKENPLSSSAFYTDGAAARELIPGTIARGHLDEDEQFYTGKIGSNFVTTLPFPVTREILECGRERFDIYCAECHDRIGCGRGMIVQRGFPAPPTFHQDRLRDAPIGHFYDVITEGYGVMYSYAARVEPADRWAIAAYIRALQLSEHATLDQVLAGDRAALNQSPP